MRSSVLAAAPFAAAVSAQALSTITGRVQTATISQSGSALYTSTWTYSNPATAYLSETDSNSVVTGMAQNTAVADADQPAAVTSMPPVATIPAGLPAGVTNIKINATDGFTSFSISVGSSTTVLLGGTGTVNNDGSVNTGAAGGSSSGNSSGSDDSDSDSSSSGSNNNSNSNSNNDDSDSSDNSPSASGSASPSQSGNAASSVQVAGAGMGLLAFIAALL